MTLQSELAQPVRELASEPRVCLLMGPQAKAAWTSSVFWKSPVSWSSCSDKPVLSWDPFNHIVWRPGRPSQHLSALRRPGTRTGLNSCIIWKMVKLWMQSGLACHFPRLLQSVAILQSLFCALSIYIIIHRHTFLAQDDIENFKVSVLKAMDTVRPVKCGILPLPTLGVHRPVKEKLKREIKLPHWMHRQLEQNQVHGSLVMSPCFTSPNH